MNCYMNKFLLLFISSFLKRVSFENQTSFQRRFANQLGFFSIKEWKPAYSLKNYWLGPPGEVWTFIFSTSIYV